MIYYYQTLLDQAMWAAQTHGDTSFKVERALQFVTKRFGSSFSDQLQDAFNQTIDGYIQVSRAKNPSQTDAALQKLHVATGRIWDTLETMFGDEQED
jgi:hypothetical protein